MPAEIETIECAVTRVEQSTDYYCGAACSAMVFSFFDMWVQQDRAYAAIRAGALEPNAWYADPQGMSACLNSPEFVPDQIRFEVLDFVGEDVSPLLQRIHHNLAVVRMPCPVLVRGGMHWVIVDGVRCARRDDGGYDILGLFLTDPFRTEPSRKLVTVETASEEYLTPIRFGTHWRGRLAMMSDSSAALANVAAKSQMGGGAGALSESEAAQKGIEFLGYTGAQPPRLEAFAGDAATPVLSLETGRQIYSLVPVDCTANVELRRLVFTAVEWNTNRLLEVCLDIRKIAFLKDAAVADLLRGKFGAAARIVVEPGYFWTECLELRSRFTIVRRATVDGAVVYVLPGGEILSSLTTPALGGA